MVLDLNSLTNLMLLVCVAIFIAAFAYRALSSLMARPRYGEAQPAAVRFIGRSAALEPPVVEESAVSEEPSVFEEPGIPQGEFVGPGGELDRAQAVAGPRPVEEVSEKIGPRRVQADFRTVAAELLSLAATEDAEAIRAVARELVDYSLARGGVSKVRPEVLENLALQFAALEVAMRKASTSPDGQPAAIPQDLRKELFREGFRLVASQAKH